MQLRLSTCLVAAAMLALAAPAMAEPPSALAPEASGTAPAAEPLRSYDAKKLAEKYAESMGIRSPHAGQTRLRDGVFTVKIETQQGLPLMTIKVDAATGQILPS